MEFLKHVDPNTCSSEPRSFGNSSPLRPAYRVCWSPKRVQHGQRQQTVRQERRSEEEMHSVSRGSFCSKIRHKMAVSPLSFTWQKSSSGSDSSDELPAAARAAMAQLMEDVRITADNAFSQLTFCLLSLSVCSPSLSVLPLGRCARFLYILRSDTATNIHKDCLTRRIAAIKTSDWWNHDGSCSRGESYCGDRCCYYCGVNQVIFIVEP